jgi:hypothetical protein
MKMLGQVLFGGGVCLTSAMTGLCQCGTGGGNSLPFNTPGEPAVYQIVITEIMADPNPPVGLPGAEYIELYNRGESAVSLEGCRLILGKTQRVLPAVLLDPKAYLIVCDASSEKDFIASGPTLAMENMPRVVNSGMTLTLKTLSGKVIFSVAYSDRWYHSAEKSGGGWSLEMTDPDNVCGRADNWHESSDVHGGTPGRQNSGYARNPDRQRPKPLRAILLADSSIMIRFSESMDSTSLNDAADYSADQGLLHPSRVDPVEPGYTAVNLGFGSRLIPGFTYHATVMNTLRDCAGNTIDNNAVVLFGLPQAADSLDVVINEILFDVPRDLSEFIELYNRSDKIVDLSGYSLVLCNPASDSMIRQTPLKDDPFLLFPDHFVAITRQSDHLANIHDHLETVIEEPRLFVLPDREGEISLTDGQNRVMDRFQYSYRMHSGFLSETEGISLERIRADQSANDISNWCSAASANGYSTPGYENSQGLSTNENEILTVAPVVFSPDGDGTDDVSVLWLDTGDPGYIGNIRIFDNRGKLVKTLASHTLFGTETMLTWDGSCNDLTPADIGIYLIYIELFNQKGIIKNFRKVVTLVRKI